MKYLQKSAKMHGKKHWNLYVQERYNTSILYLCTTILILSHSYLNKLFALIIISYSYVR